MSWEEMVPDIRPCWCGNGTITYVTEMDDWNRVRHHTRIECEVCKTKAEENARLKQQRHQERENLLARAKLIAEDRYLNGWLAMFAGLNKRETWLLLTDGSGYPALGTFYKHVKEEGVSQYLSRNFSHDFQKALAKMGVKDNEVQDLLAARERI